MDIYKQDDFSGGLNTQLDSEKTTKSAYPLLINGRVRRNVVSPTRRNIRLDLVDGNYQALYAAGSYLIIFVSGVAYYADIAVDPITFQLVPDWVTMDPTKQRLYAELVPATANFFNREGEPEDTTTTFNNTIAAFTQAMFVFDDINRPQAILPNGQARPLQDYDNWTKSHPEYVPIGKLPCMAGNKLFLVATDHVHILHSVTGRSSDFVVNITVDGEKGGDASTVAQTVSYNDVTALKALSTSQLLVGTLYGAFLLDFDYERPQFGEPYLRPTFLFPAGPLNEISIIDILEDTAMITQTGIHAFNAVAQAKKESNNFPLGAKIRGLLNNPQSDTCAGSYDDFALFAVNTIFGYGVLAYDTIMQGFHSIDLTFGRVKQFANTKVHGIERLFYITHDNEIFEAFASDTKNVTRMYLGEFTPDSPGKTAMVDVISLAFANVRGPGIVKLTIFRDNIEHESISLINDTPVTTHIPPIPIPYVRGNQVFTPEWQLSHVCRGYRVGLLIEWNFDGDLTNIGFNGQFEAWTSTNRVLEAAVPAPVKFAFFAESGYTDELAPSGDFPAEGFVTVSVVLGADYVYIPNSAGILLNGNRQMTAGTFRAQGPAVYVKGTGTVDFSIRTATNYMAVLDAVYKEENLHGIIHGGNFAYTQGTMTDVLAAKTPIKIPIYPVGGDVDRATDEGTAFYNKMGVPNYYSKRFGNLDVFFYNSDLDAPDGVDEDSIQAAVVKNWALNSDATFKLLVIPDAPYTSGASALDPGGRTDLRFFANYGIDAILSGRGKLMERIIVNDFPYFVCGSGGQSLDEMSVDPRLAVFRNNVDFGYLLITLDALTCTLQFKDTLGTVLDRYDIYA